MQCLSKSPSDRFQTADDLAGEMRAAMKPAASLMRRVPLRWMYAVAAFAILIALLIPGIRQAVISRIRGGGTVASNATAAVPAGNELDLYRAGRAYLDRYDKPGNLNRAIELMQSSIQKNRNYAPAYAGLSEAYLRRNVAAPDQNWIALARDSARKSIALEADLALGHVALGYALLETGKRAEAATEFERGQELDPTNPAAAAGSAKIAAVSGNHAEAEAMFRKGIELGKSQWLPFMEYGMFLFANERYDEAIKAYERARELSPDNVTLLANEGAAYHMAGHYDEAAALFQQALAIEPNARIYANLGTLRFFQGRFSDAVDPMERAVQLRATYYLYWGNLGDVYRWAPGLRSKANGAYARAIDLIRKSIAAAPEDPVLRARLAGYLAKSDQSDAALAELERFEQIAKKTGMALFKAAIAYEVAGKRDAALRSLESAQRAGYSTQEIETEQELTGLRADIRYQQALARLTHPGGPANVKVLSSDPNTPTIQILLVANLPTGWKWRLDDTGHSVRITAVFGRAHHGTLRDQWYATPFSRGNQNSTKLCTVFDQTYGSATAPLGSNAQCLLSLGVARFHSATLTSISPSSIGAQTGATQFTITGGNLAGATLSWSPSAVYGSIASTSATQITGTFGCTGTQATQGSVSAIINGESSNPLTFTIIPSQDLSETSNPSTENASGSGTGNAESTTPGNDLYEFNVGAKLFLTDPSGVNWEFTVGHDPDMDVGY